MLSVTTLLSTVQWLSVLTILSPPPSWSLSPRRFGLWLFPSLLLSTLPFICTSSLLEYSYISQTHTERLLLYVQGAPGTSDLSVDTAIKMRCCHRASISVPFHFKSFCCIGHILQAAGQGLFLWPCPQFRLGHSVMCITLETLPQVYF